MSPDNDGFKKIRFAQDDVASLFVKFVVKYLTFSVTGYMD